MKKLYKYRILLCIICILTSSFIYAHGSLTIRINAKTEEIRKHPKKAVLYLERGFLYEQHEEYNNAIADYIKSEKLGNTDKLIQYRKAQTYYYKSNFAKALASSSLYLKKDSIDVKINKLHAQILVQLGAYNKALKYYDYFIKNTLDIFPSDIIEYSEVYLAINKNNYPKAIEVIDIGLKKIGKNTFSLQLKKLEYLETSLQVNEAIEQYNYFILNTNRKEFWYYKKAKYLFENQRKPDAKIAIQQAETALFLLNKKNQNTSAIKNLKNKISKLKHNLLND